MKVKVFGHLRHLLGVPEQGIEVLLDEPVSLQELVNRLWNLPFTLFVGAKVGDIKVSGDYVVTGQEDEIVLLSPVGGG
ncbi:hypothetical protein HPY42_02095 [Coprothermobacteraceae bacterium]|nr:hypothetical protein [Coprothermobacteraceae bacterium]